MKRIFLFTLVFACACLVAAQQTYILPTADTDTPDLEYTTGNGGIFKTSRARIILYLPADSLSKPLSTLLVCPGGGYEFLSTGNEADYVQKWALQHNLAIAVLIYRLPAGRENLPLEDARAAMNMLRDSAAVWNLDPQRIGVMGFSAGGHLAGSLLTMYETQKERPDFGVLVYPVLSMEDNTEPTTREHLLGKNFTRRQIKRWHLCNNVTSETPPCFVVACQDDDLVPVSNSIDFYSALTQHGVSAELFIMPKGGHGWGFQREIPQTAIFRQSLLQWMSEL